MKSASTYKAAQVVSPIIETIFKQLIKDVPAETEHALACAPDAQVIESIIDAAFWASLRKEEGRSPRVSLAYVSPEQAGSPMIFATPLPLTAATLTKLGPGFERPGIHLGVWGNEDNLYIWGATLNIPHFCFVLDVSEPGLVVIKHRRMDGFGKFSNIAVLTGDEVKIVDDKTEKKPACQLQLKSMLDFTSTALWNESVNVLLQLAVSMRAHNRGGTLLVVPSETRTWLSSIRHPLHYSIDPSFCGLSNLMKLEETEKEESSWQRSLSREVDIVAGLTAIDGAIVMNDQYEVLAFGEKITHMEGKPLVEQIINTEPIKDGKAHVVHPAHSGGTRHLSAAQFVQDQRDAIAMVASQDGKFTVFAWSEPDNMVQAHRIDTLLM